MKVDSEAENVCKSNTSQMVFEGRGYFFILFLLINDILH